MRLKMNEPEILTTLAVCLDWQRHRNATICYDSDQNGQIVYVKIDVKTFTKSDFDKIVDLGGLSFIFGFECTPSTTDEDFVSVVLKGDYTLIPHRFMSWEKLESVL